MVFMRVKLVVKHFEQCFGSIVSDQLMLMVLNKFTLTVLGVHFRFKLRCMMGLLQAVRLWK